MKSRWLMQSKAGQWKDSNVIRSRGTEGQWLEEHIGISSWLGFCSVALKTEIEELSSVCTFDMGQDSEKQNENSVAKFFLSRQQNCAASSSAAARAYGRTTTAELTAFLGSTSRHKAECILISVRVHSHFRLWWHFQCRLVYLHPCLISYWNGTWTAQQLRHIPRIHF